MSQAAAPAPVAYSLLVQEIADGKVEQLQFGADEKTVVLKTTDGATQVLLSPGAWTGSGSSQAWAPAVALHLAPFFPSFSPLVGGFLICCPACLPLFPPGGGGAPVGAEHAHRPAPEE